MAELQRCWPRRERAALQYFDRLHQKELLTDDTKAWWDAFWAEQLATDWASTAGELTCVAPSACCIRRIREAFGLASCVLTGTGLCCAGRPLDFAWHLQGANADACIDEDISDLSEDEDGAGDEDDDPCGLEALKANWQPPRIGRATDKTVSAETIGPQKFIVLRATESDGFTFEVAGFKLWLGRVRTPSLFGFLHRRVAFTK